MDGEVEPTGNPCRCCRGTTPEAQEEDGTVPGGRESRKVIVLLGPPGAGKGTQGRKLVKAFNFDYVSTGEILRDEVRRKTPLGQRARKSMEAGELVPDELVDRIIEDRLHDPRYRGGFILDGYPRNVNQARFLKKVAGDSCVYAIHLVVDPEVLLKRLSGRRHCPNCDKIYNVFFSPPRREGRCDQCGSALVQREDDREEVISERLRIYREQTRPVMDYYASQGNYFEVDGDREVTGVFAELSSIVERIAS